MKLTGQKAAILLALREGGKAGASNVLLNGICFRYGARLWEMKKLGFEIEKVCTDATCGAFSYILVSEPSEESGSPQPEPVAPEPSVG